MWDVQSKVMPQRYKPLRSVVKNRAVKNRVFTSAVVENRYERGR
jgi:hypothetical protein